MRTGHKEHEESGHHGQSHSWGISAARLLTASLFQGFLPFLICLWRLLEPRDDWRACHSVQSRAKARRGEVRGISCPEVVRRTVSTRMER